MRQQVFLLGVFSKIVEDSRYQVVRVTKLSGVLSEGAFRNRLKELWRGVRVGGKKWAERFRVGRKERGVHSEEGLPGRDCCQEL